MEILLENRLLKLMRRLTINNPIKILTATVATTLGNNSILRTKVESKLMIKVAKGDHLVNVYTKQRMPLTNSTKAPAIPSQSIAEFVKLKS